MLLYKKIILVFVPIIIFFVIIKNINSCNQDNFIANKTYSGICYFDIDDTLTTAHDKVDEIFEECLKNNFDVGIITASGRNIEHICKYPLPSWSSSKLCNILKKNDYKLFNSNIVIGGKQTNNIYDYPENYPFLNKNTNIPMKNKYGYIKGFNMVHGRDNFDKKIPNKCIVLFDDNPDVIEGVKMYNNNLETQCANPSCGLNGMLTKDIIKNKLIQMKQNGCL